MTLSLKRKTTGELLSIPKASNWYFYGMDAPDEYRLARDCDCCVLTPDGLLTEAMVDTGESATVSGTGEAVYPAGFYTPGHGSFQERYYPVATWNWGGVGSVTFTYYPPLQTSVVPAGFELHGTYGTNLNSCLHLQATLGDETDEQWVEYDGEPTVESATVTVSCSFGARLFANIEEIPRQSSSGTMWGPRPRWTDEDTKDAVDLRKYKSASLNYYYWDADASGGSVSITAVINDDDPVTLTLAGAGTPKIVNSGTASATNGVATLDDEMELSLTFFGSQALPTVTKTTYYDDPGTTRGATARTEGHSVYAKPAGASSDFRKINLSLSNIQPQRTYSSAFQIVTPHELDYADGTFTLACTDGPDPASDGAYAVNTEYPVDDAGTTGTDEGVAITITVPTDSENPWTGTGTAYQAGAWGLIDTSNWAALSEALDTIGDPAFGFTYSPTALDAAGASGDNWRCPIRIPAAAASWVAARLRVNRNPTLPATPAWSAGAGTTITGTSVTGAGTLTISQTLSADWLIDNYRYLVLRMKQSEASQTATLAIGTKEWTLNLPVSESEVIVDLCNPTNATGYDDTTTWLEARTAAGGWGWGVDGEVTLTITSAAPFDIYSPTTLDVTTGAGRLLVGETLHRWLPAFEVGDIVLREGDEYLEDTITTYATRGILYISDGRVVLDEEVGLTADGFDAENPLTTLPYNAYIALKISDVIRAANVRQGNSSKAAVALLEDRKPARFFSRVGWDGTFFWTDKAEFFNGQVEAYMLRPTRAAVTTSTYDIYADYCVDRIKPGVGVSCTLGSTKWLGGGLHGITVVDDVADAAAVAADTTSSNSDTTSRDPDGYYEIPGDEMLNSTTTDSGHDSYNIITGWDGTPAGDVVEGTLMRVTVRKSSA